MSKVKVPLGGTLFELSSGRQLVPGELEELSAEEEKDNADLLNSAFENGTLLKADDVKEKEKAKGGE